MRKIFYSPLVFPLLSTIYPILSLYLVNADMLKISVTYLPLIVALLATGLILVIGKLLLKDWVKSGFLTFSVVVLFFSYGHIHNIANQLPFGRHRYLLPISGMLFALAVWGILKLGSQLKSAVPIFNLITAILVALPILGVALNVPDSTSSTLKTDDFTADGVSQLTDLELPDIYYIILDGYTSTNILLDEFGYDNSAFIDSITSMGFYVANESRSNYAATFLSLASSLNMEYLDQIPAQIGFESLDRSIPYRMIDDNRVTRFLRSKGYTIVHFSSGWGATDFNTLADKNYRGGVFGGVLNEFGWTLLDTTLLSYMGSRIAAYDLGNRIIYNLNTLGELPTQEEPRFVFAHLLIPHPPFLFDRDGNPVDQSIFTLSGDYIWAH